MSTKAERAKGEAQIKVAGKVGTEGIFPPNSITEVVIWELTLRLFILGGGW